MIPLSRTALVALLFATLPVTLAGPALAQPTQNPVLLLSAHVDGPELQIGIESNLPLGARIHLRLQRRGRSVASARVVLTDRHVETRIPVPPGIPPSFYDVSAVWVPEPSSASAAGDGPAPTVVSVLVGTREMILERRNEERGYYGRLLDDLRMQFRSFASDLEQAGRTGADPSAPDLRSAFRSSLALVSSYRNGLTDRETRLGLPLLEEAHFLAAELIDHLASLHHEALSAGEPGALDRGAPPVFDEGLMTALRKGFDARASALEQALEWDRALGHPDLAVHVVRSCERVRRWLVLARSRETLRTAETDWRAVAAPLAEDLKQVEDDARILTPRSEQARRHPALESLVQLAADLRSLWRELEATLAGRSPAWKGFDERDRLVRDRLRQVVTALGLDWVDPE